MPQRTQSSDKQRAWYEACRDALKGRKTYFIGVHCPLEVLVQREKSRSDRRAGLAEWQFGRVHEKKAYAFEVDTSQLGPEECAAAILKLVSSK